MVRERGEGSRVKLKPTAGRGGRGGSGSLPPRRLLGLRLGEAQPPGDIQGGGDAVDPLSRPPEMGNPYSND